jgi:hypothetical protein
VPTGAAALAATQNNRRRTKKMTMPELLEFTRMTGDPSSAVMRWLPAAHRGGGLTAAPRRRGRAMLALASDLHTGTAIKPPFYLVVCLVMLTLALSALLPWLIGQGPGVRAVVHRSVAP